MATFSLQGVDECDSTPECGVELLMKKQTRQHGGVLLVTLVILLLLTIAMASMMRSVNTGNQIAGNLAFKEAARAASDRAISDALNNLANITPSDGGNTNIQNKYFSSRQTALDSKGVPTAINWSNVICTDENGAIVTGCDTSTEKYRIQYLIERRCESNPDLSNIIDIKTKCDYEVRQHASSGPPAVAEQIAIFYRVIIRVRGPRNAKGMYEVMLSGPTTS